MSRINILYSRDCHLFSVLDTLCEKLGYLTQSVFLLHPSRVITGTTTGKLVLWDFKPNGNPAVQRPAKLIIEQKELTMDNRELTRDTFKSSTSTRSGTLSSRKSSAKSEENNDLEKHSSPMNKDSQPETSCKSTLRRRIDVCLFRFLSSILGTIVGTFADEQTSVETV